MLGSREDIDLERELHCVYRMFLEGQAKLLSLKGCPVTCLSVVAIVTRIRSCFILKLECVYEVWE